ncbi:MAG: RNA polymerase sigma factor [Balneolaceae bacterium]|nr:RNA polymerase sigma factor [Balneolaceae bacterium]
MQESELIRQLQLGNRDAFRRLVEDYKDRVYNTCLGFLRDPYDAEDMAQEVFMKVYESIADFRADAALGTWIYRIAVSKCLELNRKRKRKKRFAYFQALWNSDGDPDETTDGEFFPHPGIAIENKERAQILMSAIEGLPEQQRVAFTLHKLEHLSYKEIADVMDTSLSAIESLMHRAKKNLQKELRDYYTSDLN